MSSSSLPTPRVCTPYGSKFVEMLSSDESVPQTAASQRAGSPRSAPVFPTEWSPLTKSEARALIQSQLSPSTAPAPLSTRLPMPRVEINRLARKIALGENTLQRTLRPIPSSVAAPPSTPDQRILHACRRKSYTAPVDYFERDVAPLW
ncbi:hypothetical protein MVEN_00833900 [Mycena venus]|uniref:Uncharacterized protein n=1 Tax=Mycena venus TaxID=2733690 RepID=A0A8H6YG19_9AGAR|nr:hypothetical protein MVEN_00833900 [Mycena venus]